MAALTLTNLLFETMIKLTLAYYDADGRTMDEEGVEFESILLLCFTILLTRSRNQIIISVRIHQKAEADGECGLFFFNNV